MNIVVFVSGRGSNLKNIINTPELHDLITIKFVVSNVSECGAFEVARQSDIETIVVREGENHNAINYFQLLEIFDKYSIELVVLAGFLKLIPKFFIQHFSGKIINVHPALLPKFGGKGMYGINVHTTVFNSGEKKSGATVHFVNEKYDEGSIILQECVDITKLNSPVEIASEVLKVEHRILPFVIMKFAQNKIEMKNGRVHILD